MNKKHSKDEEIYLPDEARCSSDEVLLLVQVTDNGSANGLQSTENTVSSLY